MAKILIHLSEVIKPKGTKYTIDCMDTDYAKKESYKQLGYYWQPSSKSWHDDGIYCDIEIERTERIIKNQIKNLEGTIEIVRD